jgi:hypothetical protein
LNLQVTAVELCLNINYCKTRENTVALSTIRLILTILHS